MIKTKKWDIGYSEQAQKFIFALNANLLSIMDGTATAADRNLTGNRTVKRLKKTLFKVSFLFTINTMQKLS